MGLLSSRYFAYAMPRKRLHGLLNSSHICLKIDLAIFEDVRILKKSTQARLDNLRQVFKRFQQYDLKFNPRKYEFFRE